MSHAEKVLDREITQAIEAAVIAGAMAAGNLNAALSEKANESAKALEADLRAKVTTMAHELRNAHHREDAMVRRAMQWNAEFAPATMQDHIKFSYDREILALARDWRTVAVESVRRMMDEAHVRIGRLA